MDLIILIAFSLIEILIAVIAGVCEHVIGSDLRGNFDQLGVEIYRIISWTECHQCHIFQIHIKYVRCEHQMPQGVSKGIYEIKLQKQLHVKSE